MLTINFEKLGLQSGDRVLDIGCGEGRHCVGATLQQNDIDVFGVDLNQHDIHSALTRHREFDLDSAQQCLYLQGDALELPFADNSFDHVICSEVLEHIPDYQTLLKEAKRVLKPSGNLCISVPRFWPEKICWWLSSAYHQVEGGHIRIFKAKNLLQDIEALHFKLQSRHWAHALHVPYWWLRCAFWKKGEDFFLTRWYHKLLVWDLLKRPWLTQSLERALNPLLGKSVVMYFKN